MNKNFWKLSRLLRTTLNYLVRAQNACPSGSGTLGLASSGLPRAGLDCP
jgi:hypothetical protein